MLALALAAAALAAAPAPPAAPAGRWQHDAGATPVVGPPVPCAGGASATPTVAPLEMYAPADPDDLALTRSTPVRVTIAPPAGVACPDVRATVEVVVPEGARLADWHEPPVRCDGAPCRVAYRTGDHGGLVVDGPWPLHGDGTPLTLEVPVAYYAPLGAAQKVKAYVTFRPVAESFAPVPPTEVGVAMVAGGEGDGCCDPIDDDPRPEYDQGAPLPTTLTRHDVKHGIRFRLEGTAGTKATVALRTRGGALIATTSRTARSRSVLELVLKAGRTGAERIKKPIAATLTITRRGGAYPELTFTRPLRIR
jgi:hypothetical protein